jgi:hypothetical protein
MVFTAPLEGCIIALKKGVKGALEMAHMMKFTKASCGHMFAHFDRRAEHISNENLDRTRTHLNYNLATHQTMDQGEFVRKRCAEVRCQNRKDVNVMVSWVVTAPKDLPVNEQRAFFEASYDFLKKRYGLENVVSAYVHMDEVTPHMHFAFVPVVEDKRRGGFKVSAKECVNRYDLQSFHEDLQRYVERELGHEVGILNEATKEGNRSIEELKRQSATERLQEATAEASKIVSKAQEEVQWVKDSLTPLQAEYEAKKAFIRACDKASDVSVMYPTYAEKKKSLFGKETVTVPKEKWEQKHVSANEKGYLQKATAEFEKAVAEFRKTSSADHIAQLEQKVSLLERKVYDLKRENSTLRSQVVSAEKEADRVMDKVNKVLGKLPEDMVDRFVKEWKAPERSRGFDMER